MKKHGKLPTEPQAQQKPLVLYVEDEASNIEVAHAKLSRDYERVIAMTDAAACEALRSARPLHAILMDIQLKGSALNGVALARVIRGRSEPGVVLPPYARDLPKHPDTPIFFVTAYGARYGQGELDDVADGVVSKPVDFVRLATAIARAAVRNIR